MAFFLERGAVLYARSLATLVAFVIAIVGASASPSIQTTPSQLSIAQYWPALPNHHIVGETACGAPRAAWICNTL